MKITIKALSLSTMLAYGCMMPLAYASPPSLQETRQLAEQGNAKAQYDLGVTYEYGIGGVIKDAKKAAELYKKATESYRKAAEQGDAEAQYSLGTMYHNGRGVTKDYKRAITWYRKAAEKGVAKAQYNLGVMYTLGKGVPQNDKQAAELYKKATESYRKAAEQGDAEAQYSLGLIYQIGRIVPQDYKQAYAWFSVAAANGSEDGSRRRDFVAKQLNSTALRDAQALAKRYLANTDPSLQKSTFTLKNPKTGSECVFSVNEYGYASSEAFGYQGTGDCWDISMGNKANDYIKMHGLATPVAKAKARAETEASKAVVDEVQKLWESQQRKTNSDKEIQIYTLKNANDDARHIWIQSCLNAKSIKVEPAFIFYQRYPKIHMLHVAKLYSNANQIVEFLNGVIDCEEQGKYYADTYTSGIDIRNN